MLSNLRCCKIGEYRRFRIPTLRQLVGAALARRRTATARTLARPRRVHPRLRHCRSEAPQRPASPRPYQDRHRGRGSTDLGIDVRGPLDARKIAEAARWRTRGEPIVAATARTEAIRLTKRIHELDAELD